MKGLILIRLLPVHFNMISLTVKQNINPDYWFDMGNAKLYLHADICTPWTLYSNPYDRKDYQL